MGKLQVEIPVNFVVLRASKPLYNNWCQVEKELGLELLSSLVGNDKTVTVEELKASFNDYLDTFYVLKQKLPYRYLNNLNNLFLETKFFIKQCNPNAKLGLLLN